MEKIKKKVVNLCAVFTAIVLATSCSPTMNDETILSNEQNSLLLETLENYNKNVIMNTPSTRVSERTLNIIVEDIYGAFKGGQKAYKFTKNFPDKRVTIACTLLGGAIL